LHVYFRAAKRNLAEVVDEELHNIIVNTLTFQSPKSRALDWTAAMIWLRRGVS
jgi:hypothetical protein